MEQNIIQNSKYDPKEIRKKVISMLLPITGENVLQMAAGFVSTAMIGRIEGYAVAALGLSMRVTQLVWAIFKGIATGAAVFVAQAYGAEDSKRIKEVIIQTLISSMIFVIVIQQLIFWNAKGILTMFFKNSNPSLIEHALSHLKMASIGLPFLGVILIVGGVLQAMGDAKTPMKISFILNILNIIFGYIFIFGKMGAPKMGLMGAAIGLVIAQFISAILALYALFSKKEIFKDLSKEDFKLRGKKIKDIYKLSVPSSMESIFWQISAILLTNIILSYGEVTLEAYQVGLQAESVSYTPAVGLCVAATAFIGQTVGAKDPKLGKAYMKEIIFETLIITAFSSLILLFLPRVLLGILTNKAEVIEVAVKYLIVMGIIQIPQNLASVYSGALKGAGYTKIPMIIVGVGIWGVRILGSFLISKYVKGDISLIWYIIGLDLIVRYILSVIIYKKKNIYENNVVV